MGNKLVIFTEEQLEKYQDCTFFTRKEILRAFKRYRDIAPSIIPKAMIKDEASTISIPLESMEKLPEIKENPFRKRICQVFSDDNSGNMTFENFLDFLSAFNDHASRDIKIHYAFKIYDMDDDDFIDTEDIDQALKLLTKNELTVEERKQIAEKIIEETDIDGDGKVSFMEFEHVIARAPDFVTTFRIRI